MSLEEDLTDIIDQAMTGGRPDFIALGKGQYRMAAPLFSDSVYDAVKRLYNRGYRGDGLKLTKQEAWVLR